jgi:hypothetical protein
MTTYSYTVFPCFNGTNESYKKMKEDGTMSIFLSQITLKSLVMKFKYNEELDFHQNGNIINCCKKNTDHPSLKQLIFNENDYQKLLNIAEKYKKDVYFTILHKDDRYPVEFVKYCIN